MGKLVALTVGLFLTGCAASMSGTDLADSSCRSFRPIAASKADTEQTKRQVVAHNKVYDTVCKPLPAQPKATS